MLRINRNSYIGHLYQQLSSTQPQGVSRSGRQEGCESWWCGGVLWNAFFWTWHSDCTQELRAVGTCTRPTQEHSSQHSGPDEEVLCRPHPSWGPLTLWLQAAVSGVCTHFISWVWSEQAPAIAVTTGSCVGSVARNHIKDSDGTQAMLESVGLQPRGADAAWVSSVLAVLQLLHLLTATTRHKRGCFDNYTHDKHIFKSHSWYFSQLPITRKSLNNFHLKSEIKNKQTNKQSKQLDTIWCDISIRFWGAFVKTMLKKNQLKQNIPSIMARCKNKQSSF